MYVPDYIDLKAAREVLQEIGIHLNERQMKRAAEMDGHGNRKLPFFKDPIDGKLKIERRKLLGIYSSAQLEACESARYTVEVTPPIP